QQRGNDRVGIEDGSDYFRLLRAQRIAPSTSFSVNPRRRIFSRTAVSVSPLPLMTTGVNTTSPPRSETSKYSALGSCRTIALGSVIWFLEVFLANILFSVM